MNPDLCPRGAAGPRKPSTSALVWEPLAAARLEVKIQGRSGTVGDRTSSGPALTLDGWDPQRGGDQEAPIVCCPAEGLREWGGGLTGAPLKTGTMTLTV